MKNIIRDSKGNCIEKHILESFSGYRIAHVSDLHNAEIGEGNTKLLTMLYNAKPDMIVITRDYNMNNN